MLAEFLVLRDLQGLQGLRVLEVSLVLQVEALEVRTMVTWRPTWTVTSSPPGRDLRSFADVSGDLSGSLVLREREDRGASEGSRDCGDPEAGGYFYKNNF